MGLRVNVIELQERPGWAASAGLIHESALSTIALVNFTPNRARDVAGARLFSRRGSSLVLGALRLALAEPLLLQLCDQQIDGTLHHHGQIAARVGVAHEVRGTRDLLLQLLAGCELNLVAGD